jgi:hypothetical protein
MSATCIYPGPHGVMSEEHYLPVALGRFQGYEPLYNRVCSKCNKRIGDAVEEQFLRAGTIAFFRYMLGIEGRDGPLPSPFYRGAGGAPPLHMVGRPQGINYDLLLEVEPGTDTVSPLRQIIFDHPIAGWHPIAILDRMRGHPEVLIEHLREHGLESAKPVHVFVAPDDISWVTELLKAVGGVSSGDWATTSFTPQKIQLVVDIKVTEAHFRAVAKIAFHYTLKVFPDLTGMEHDFEPIKEYIWVGSNARRFVKQNPRQFVHNFLRGYRPTHWMHILAVERTYDSIVAHAQFFAGPHSLPPPYKIWIGRNPSRIDHGRELRAHQFVILNPTTSSGTVGIMEEAQPAQYVRPL